MNNYNAEMWSFPRPQNRSVTTDELYDQIKNYIEEGLLKPGQRLPSYRKIAVNARISRTSVFRVYERLVDKGWVKTSIGSGTFVAHNFPNYELLYPLTRTIKSLPLSLEILSESKIERACHFHDFISIGFDSPGPHYAARLLNMMRSKKYVMYGEFDQTDRVRSMDGLAYKAAILDYMNSKRDFMITIDGLEIVVGRNESLRQVFNILLSPGDTVVNTSPKDNQLCDILNSYRALEMHHIDLNEDFLKKLKKLLSYKRIKVLYIRSQCSYPEGYTLENDMCNQLLLLAKRHGFYIVEEDDYHEFWDESKPFKPLVNRNHNGHVIYCGAFSCVSKYLEQTRAIVAAEEFIDLIKSNPVGISRFRDYQKEMILVDLLNNNKLWQLIKKMQQDMRRNKFNAWMQINNHLTKFVKVKKSSGGLCFWLEAPCDEWLKKSLLFLQDKGIQITYSPGSQTAGAGVQKVRLGFGT